MNKLSLYPLKFDQAVTDLLKTKPEPTAKKTNRRSAVTLLSALLLAIVLATPAFSQEFHFGIKGGVPLTDYFHTRPSYSSATRRYTIGASAEFQFSRALGVELDALYKRMGYVGQTACCFVLFNGIFTTTKFDVTGNSWEFPLLLKYRFDRSLRPFLSGGGVIRYIASARARGTATLQNLIERTTVTTPFDSSDPFNLRKRVWPGVAVGGGVEFGRARLRIVPEVRYTRWISNIGPEFQPLRFNQNQVEVLLGFVF